MDKRGFAVTTAESVEEGIKIAESIHPRFALIDLRLADGRLDAQFPVEHRLSGSDSDSGLHDTAG